MFSLRIIFLKGHVINIKTDSRKIKIKSLTTLTWEFSPSCKIKKKINVWNILEENNQVKCNLVEISFSIEKKNTK